MSSSQFGLDDAATEIGKWNGPESDAPSIARTLLAFCDWTSLESRETERNVRMLCERAIDARVAAVCVYPYHLPIVVQELRRSNVLACTVAGGFPHGMSPTRSKVDEIRWCVECGAHEVDCVFNRSAWRSGHEDYCRSEVEEMRRACEGKVMKLIMETCDFESGPALERAARMARIEGVDFLKTSTGKGSSGASLEVSALLWGVATERGDQRCGVKVSGGIKDFGSAVDYLRQAEAAMMGEEVSVSQFRIGASSLVPQLISISKRSPA